MNVHVHATLEDDAPLDATAPAQSYEREQHGQSAPARFLCRRRARLAALAGSPLPERGRPTERPATLTLTLTLTLTTGARMACQSTYTSW
eukprot:scaffold78517_cov48-Phaeocystis_antarctica.AAC.3